MSAEDRVSVRLLGFKALAPLMSSGLENANKGGGYRFSGTAQR